MQPRPPVGAVMAVEAPVLGHDEGLLQQGRDIFQRHDLVQIPVVLVGHRQRHAAPVAYLNPAHVVAVRDEPLRQRPQPDEGGKKEKGDKSAEDIEGEAQTFHVGSIPRR